MPSCAVDQDRLWSGILKTSWQQERAREERRREVGGMEGGRIIAPAVSGVKNAESLEASRGRSVKGMPQSRGERLSEG